MKPMELASLVLAHSQLTTRYTERRKNQQTGACLHQGPKCSTNAVLRTDMTE